MFAIRKFCVQTCLFSFDKPNLTMSLLLLIVLGNILVSTSDAQFRTKRADIDLQTCIDNFDIHRDKIIRTQDSQNMGAKYLNEIDLGTREECLRLCCETENCDVFVFEEKNSGSCYLFHCGPPEDFKCKFTHHVNYSSAVLAINRHSPDLESQIKLTKHEQDLSKLRKPESEPEVIPQQPETPTIPPTPSTTTTKTKEVETKTKPPEEGGTGRKKCSRYQFECRSTSECIAIYNACDGIPQCADGSDEGPELACPDSLTTANPVPVHLSNPAQPPRYETNIPAQQIHPLPPVLSQPEIYRPPIPQEALGPPQMPSVIRQEQDFLRPNPRDSINPQVPFDNQQIAQYAAGPLQMQANNWMGHPNRAMVPQIQYTDKNSHIFNHKENGLQVPDGQEISQMQYMEGREPYGPKVSSYYDNYRQMPQENWPGNPEEVQFSGYPQDNPLPEVRKNPTFPDQTFGNNKKNPSHEQEKMAHELKHSKEKTSEQETKIKIEKHKHVQKDPYPDVVTYKMDGTGDLADGIAETASGAVLSLTLGLVITCIMALLIACRLRVKRRIRKGGKSYAHDADYLVNGMYL